MKTTNRDDETLTGERVTPNSQRMSKGVALKVFSGRSRGLHSVSCDHICVLEVQKTLVKA